MALILRLDRWAAARTGRRAWRSRWDELLHGLPPPAVQMRGAARRGAAAAAAAAAAATAAAAAGAGAAAAAVAVAQRALPIPQRQRRQQRLALRTQAERLLAVLEQRPQQRSARAAAEVAALLLPAAPPLQQATACCASVWPYRGGGGGRPTPPPPPQLACLQLDAVASAQLCRLVPDKPGGQRESALVLDGSQCALVLRGTVVLQLLVPSGAAPVAGSSGGGGGGGGAPHGRFAAAPVRECYREQQHVLTEGDFVAPSTLELLRTTTTNGAAATLLLPGVALPAPLQPPPPSAGVAAAATAAAQAGAANADAQAVLALFPVRCFLACARARKRAQMVGVVTHLRRWQQLPPQRASPRPTPAEVRSLWSRPRLLRLAHACRPLTVPAGATIAMPVLGGGSGGESGESGGGGEGGGGGADACALLLLLSGRAGLVLRGAAAAGGAASASKQVALPLPLPSGSSLPAMVGGWGVWPRAAALMLAAAGMGAAAIAAGTGGDGGSSGGAGGKGGVASVDVEFNALASCEVLYISRRALARCCLQALPDGGGGGTSGGRGDGGSQSGVGIGGRGREVAAMEVEAWRSAQALAARFRRGRAAVVSAAKNRAREQQQQEEEERRRRRLLQRPRRRQRHSTKPVATLAGAPRRPVGRAIAAAASPAAGAAGAAVAGGVNAATARGAVPPRTARKPRSGSAPRPGRKVVLADANRRTEARATSKT